MSGLRAALGRLFGGGVEIAPALRSRPRSVPQSTLACLELIIQRDAASEWLGSRDEVYRELKPSQALAVVELARRLGGDPAFVADVRRNTVPPLVAAQTGNGFFDLAFYYSDDDVRGPPSFAPIPGAIRSTRNYTIWRIPWRCYACSKVSIHHRGMRPP